MNRRVEYLVSWFGCPPLHPSDSLLRPFRFPNGESGADVYDRITLFVDHLVRDMIIGR